MTSGKGAYRGGETCPSCRSSETTSRGECMACGHVFGESFRCPFCAKTTRPKPDPLLVATCPSCSEPRIDPSLGADAYDALRKKRRAYMRLHVRALVYVPLFSGLGAGLVAIGAALFGARRRADALLGQPYYQAGYYVVPAHESHPQSIALVLVSALVVLGGAGLAGYAVAAYVLRQRVLAEATRLVELAPRS
jgi:hypothetical protein